MARIFPASQVRRSPFSNAGSTSGSARWRVPVNANRAFATAGASGGTPDSPTPAGASRLGTSHVSTTGACASFTSGWLGKLACCTRPPSMSIRPCSAHRAHHRALHLLGHDRAERFVQSDAARPSSGQLAAPAGFLRGQIEHRLVPGRVGQQRQPELDRAPACRHGQFVDKALRKERVVRVADRAPETDRHRPCASRHAPFSGWRRRMGSRTAPPRWSCRADRPDPRAQAWPGPASAAGSRRRPTGCAGCRTGPTLVSNHYSQPHQGGIGRRCNGAPDNRGLHGTNHTS